MAKKFTSMNKIHALLFFVLATVQVKGFGLHKFIPGSLLENPIDPEVRCGPWGYWTPCNHNNNKSRVRACRYRRGEAPHYPNRGDLSESEWQIYEQYFRIFGQKDTEEYVHMPDIQSVSCQYGENVTPSQGGGNNSGEIPRLKIDFTTFDQDQSESQKNFDNGRHDSSDNFKIEHEVQEIDRIKEVDSHKSPNKSVRLPDDPPVDSADVNLSPNKQETEKQRDLKRQGKGRKKEGKGRKREGKGRKREGKVRKRRSKDRKNEEGGISAEEREQRRQRREERERKKQERLRKQEQERLEQERIEKERLEKEKLEKERLDIEEKIRFAQEVQKRLAREETERLKKERLEQERLEKERVEKERLRKLEEQRLEQERLRKLEEERLEQAGIEEEQKRLEQERLAIEEQERLEKERIRKEEERLEQERLEKERLAEQERLDIEEKIRFAREVQKRLAREETERLKKERLEQERLEKERLEKERLEKERLERERLEEERKKQEQQRIEQERLEKERLEQEHLEKERMEKEKIAKLEQERLEEKERIRREEQARLEQERLEQERLAIEEQERLEKERIRKEEERLEQERLEKERLAEQERLDIEEKIRFAREVQKRLAREETERLKKERLEQERLEKERVEKERLRKLEEQRLEKERLSGINVGNKRSGDYDIPAFVPSISADEFSVDGEEEDDDYEDELPLIPASIDRIKSGISQSDVEIKPPFSGHNFPEGGLSPINPSESSTEFEIPAEHSVSVSDYQKSMNKSDFPDSKLNLPDPRSDLKVPDSSTHPTTGNNVGENDVKDVKSEEVSGSFKEPESKHIKSTTRLSEVSKVSNVLPIEKHEPESEDKIFNESMKEVGPGVDLGSKSHSDTDELKLPEEEETPTNDTDEHKLPEEEMATNDTDEHKLPEEEETATNDTDDEGSEKRIGKLESKESSSQIYPHEVATQIPERKSIKQEHFEDEESIDDESDVSTEHDDEETNFNNPKPEREPEPEPEPEPNPELESEEEFDNMKKDEDSEGKFSRGAKIAGGVIGALIAIGAAGTGYHFKTKGRVEGGEIDEIDFDYTEAGDSDEVETAVLITEDVWENEV
uniref:Uncharacterized protein n=1 Tax=Theileria annulata TaxID=5874 RepID=A0A3B0N157_THEAN